MKHIALLLAFIVTASLSAQTISTCPCAPVNGAVMPVANLSPICQETCYLLTSSNPAAVYQFGVGTGQNYDPTFTGPILPLLVSYDGGNPAMGPVDPAPWVYKTLNAVMSSAPFTVTYSLTPDGANPVTVVIPGTAPVVVAPAAPPIAAMTAMPSVIWAKVADESPTVSVSFPVSALCRLGSPTDNLWSITFSVPAGVLASTYFPDGGYTALGVTDDPDSGNLKELDCEWTRSIQHITISDSSTTPPTVIQLLIPTIPPPTDIPVPQGAAYSVTLTNMQTDTTGKLTVHLVIDDVPMVCTPDVNLTTLTSIVADCTVVNY